LNQPAVIFEEPGTYTIQLTATNQFGCVDVSEQEFIVHPTPEAVFTVEPQPACAGYPVFFNNGSVNANGYQWSFGDGATSTADAPLHTYEGPGLYDVLLVATGAGGCTDTLLVPGAVLVNPTPIADYTTDTLASVRNALQFNNLSQGAVAYTWDFGDGEVSEAVHPTHLFPGDGGGYTVCLVAVNEFACPDTICKFIGVNADPGIYVPNTFTPNADGLNDVFLPVLNGYVGWNYRLLIFDRWGEVIHETRDRNEGWNGRARGRDAQIDVYVWKVIVERDGDARDHIGHVSLVR
jgi:gliding motility-associated-like protein